MPHQPIAAIEQLLREAGSLRALARRLVAPSDVDDVLQDSWVAFLQRPPAASRPPLPWLRSVVRNLASNRRRDDRRRQVHEASCGTAQAPVDTAALAQTAELHRRLAVAVEGLPEPLRAVVVLCYLHGLDSGEAGRRLGLPASTVRTRHQRALEELRAALDEQSPGGRAAWVAAVHALFGAPAARLAVGAGLGVAASAIAVAAVVALVVFVSDLGSGASGPEVRALASAGSARSDAGTTPSAGTPAAASGPERVEQPPRDAAAPATAPTGSIEGRILVDGQLPAFDLHLRLVARDDARAATAGSGDLRPRLQALRELTVSSAEQGRFRFEGLPAERPCELFVEGCEALDGAPSVPLRSPSTAVIVHLRQGPRLTGAITLPDGGPLDLAGQCELRTLDADGAVAGFEVVPFQCRADGAFAVQLRPHGQRIAATIRFEVDGRGYLHHEVPPCDRRRGADLGVLALEPVQDVELLVVDDRGLALRDATVAVDGATATARRVGADANGVCRIGFVPRRAAALRVVAPGHAPAVVASPPGGVARIELAPVVELAVRVDAALRRLTTNVRLISHGPVFVAGAPAVPGAKLVAGTGGASTEASSGSAGEPLVWSFTPSADGTLVVADLRPAIHLAVVAVDGDGRVLARCEHVLPDRGRTELVLSPR
ncbi:MAG TPA: RNA polymerase sigma factor [Planctomycetota bacterium]|nr:RNA polymerase sigma factor [Planctomycetota bacterium]